MGGREGPEIAEEVGDGVPPGGENGGGDEGLYAAERRRGEGGGEVGRDGQDVGQYNRGRSSPAFAIRASDTLVVEPG